MDEKTTYGDRDVAPPTPPFYYPQVQVILSPGLFLEQLDVCLNELLDDFSHPRMVGDHLSYPG